MEIAKILSGVLRRIRVVSPVLEEAVHRSVKRLWPECQTSEGNGFQVVGFKRGVLHLCVESHALMSEAKAFAAEGLRVLINSELEKEKERQHHGSGQLRSSKAQASDHVMVKTFRKDADYVTRIVFRVAGTQ